MGEADQDPTPGCCGRPKDRFGHHWSRLGCARPCLRRLKFPGLLQLPHPDAVCHHTGTKLAKWLARSWGPGLEAAGTETVCLASSSAAGTEITMVPADLIKGRPIQGLNISPRPYPESQTSDLEAELGRDRADVSTPDPVLGGGGKKC